MLISGKVVIVEKISFKIDKQIVLVIGKSNFSLQSRSFIWSILNGTRRYL